MCRTQLAHGQTELRREFLVWSLLFWGGVLRIEVLRGADHTFCRSYKAQEGGGRQGEDEHNRQLLDHF